MYAVCIPLKEIKYKWKIVSNTNLRPDNFNGAINETQPLKTTIGKDWIETEKHGRLNNLFRTPFGRLYLDLQGINI